MNHISNLNIFKHILDKIDNYEKLFLKEKDALKTAKIKLEFYYMSEKAKAEYLNDNSYKTTDNLIEECFNYVKKHSSIDFDTSYVVKLRKHNNASEKITNISNSIEKSKSINTNHYENINNAIYIFGDYIINKYNNTKDWDIQYSIKLENIKGLEKFDDIYKKTPKEFKRINKIFKNVNTYNEVKSILDNNNFKT